jgi:hypothetical protein
MQKFTFAFAGKLLAMNPPRRSEKGHIARNACMHIRMIFDSVKSNDQQTILTAVCSPPIAARRIIAAWSGCSSDNPSNNYETRT